MGLGRMQIPKSSDVLAGRLRDLIVEGELAEGQLLPSERALVEQTGLSRATVREALRILEVQGFLNIRAGRNGGSTVLRPDGRSVTGSVEAFVRSSGLNLGSLLETREILEPHCAELAASRRDHGALAALDEGNARMAAALEDTPDYLAANLAWHLAVAEASGNVLLAAFMKAIGAAIASATADVTFDSIDVRRTAVRAHERVTEAIRNGDAAAARRRMTRHVCGFAEAVRGDGGQPILENA